MGAKSRCTDILKELLAFRSTLIFLLTPLIFLPIPLVIKTQAAKCGYVLIIMAVYWSTEALPLAVTSFIPVVLFPFMGIMKASELSPLFFKDTNVMLIGGLILAITIEKCELHKRIALRVLSIVGGKPKWLMLGFMLPTWFLSMWISNTASTAMMLPVVQAVIGELEKTQDDMDDPDHAAKNANKESVEMSNVNSEDTKIALNGNKIHPDQSATNGQPQISVIRYTSSTDSSMDLVSNMEKSKSSFTLVTEEVDTTNVEKSRTKKFNSICTGLCLCIAYAANVGGTATITGTTPNLILKGQIDRIYREKGFTSPVTFASWMAMCVPAATIMVFLIWLWLQLLFFGVKDSIFVCCKKKTEADEKYENAVTELIKEENRKLGPMRFNEVAAAFFFVVLVLLWFFREPGFMPGWGSIFKKGYTSGSTPAIMIGIILFFFPSKLPNFLCLRRRNDDSPRGPVPPLLDWESFNKKMPWDVVMLIGGGFVLAKGVQKTGLGAWIGNQLSVFKPLPGWALVLILCLLVAFLTQVTSNTAIATIMMPIMETLAEKTGKNPLYLMFPVAVSTSFAFMLPVATPPNAIAYTSGRIKTLDMAKAGFLLNFVCVAVITLAVHTWGMAIFRFDVIPWANANSTTIVPNVTQTTNFLFDL